MAHAQTNVAHNDADSGTMWCSSEESAAPERRKAARSERRVGGTAQLRPGRRSPRKSAAAGAPLAALQIRIVLRRALRASRPQVACPAFRTIP